jgi:peptidoglycan hydrolase-like protein with peptidoglycan-binding domain
MKMNILIQKSACGLLAVALLFTLVISFTSPARAESTSPQLEQIQTLLATIEQLQAQLAQLRGGSSSGTQCTELSRSLFLGSSDRDTTGEVSKLQRFLTSTGHYTYGEVTGYYGPATQRAVQAWQASKGVVSSGSPETTGYGVVGPSTRSVIARNCSVSTPAVTPIIQNDDISVTISSISNSENPTVKGTAYGVGEVGFSVDNGDKVYGSGDIEVEDNEWSHKITKDLDDGEYTLTVYVDNSKVAQKTFEVDVVEEDPSISLTYPKRNVTFDKSESNDDVIIKWTATDVPSNTNVIIDIETEELYAGSVIGGGSSQLVAKNSSSEHRIAIDSEGTMDAGEYKVRLSLEECHSLGCNVSYTFGQLEEDLKVYDRSNYGYFTVVDGDNASVDLRVSGYGTSNEIDVDVTDTLEVTYYPAGEIDECKIIGDYSGGSDRVVEHPWPNTILAGQYGRQTFNAYSEYPAIELEELRVECSNEDSRTVATDSIEVDVDNDEMSDYKIIVDGDVESGTGISEAETRSRCLKESNALENREVRVQCSWDGDEFFDATNWKG